MASLNSVQLIGNLGHDPELRKTASGTAVTNLNVATNETFTDRSGERQERTEWHRVVIWGHQAETCAEFLAKGRKVHVQGSLRTREWEDGSGNLHRTTEIVARSVRFLDAPPVSDQYDRFRATSPA